MVLNQTGFSTDPWDVKKGENGPKLWALGSIITSVCQPNNNNMHNKQNTVLYRVYRNSMP